MNYTQFAHIPSVAEEHNVKESCSRTRETQKPADLWHRLIEFQRMPGSHFKLEYLSFELIIILNVCLFFDCLIHLEIFWSYSTQTTFFYLPPSPLNPFFFPSNPHLTFMYFALWPTEIDWGMLYEHEWRGYILKHGELTTDYDTDNKCFQFTSNHWPSSGRVELLTRV